MNTVVEKKEEGTPENVRERQYRQPLYQIRQKENEYEISVNLPGVRREEIVLDTKSDLLTLETTRGASSIQDEKALYRERYRKDYRLEFKLGREVDVQSITAKLEDGILTIKLLKTAESATRVVPVG